MRFEKYSFNIESIAATLFILLLLAYFTFHAVSGDRGLLAFMQLSKKTEEARAELDIVKAERLRLERKVSLLRNDSLDLDMLDEQARVLLGYSAEGETVYYINHNNK